ncbi:L-threonylcarbamoyladenylate synthase [Spongiibacter sp.]|uniref:L-threonylcarbamoyladenylate synthase n=1 Tax=Spongiibacter sp. TaxID=2024860 RepID=UPI00356907F9
MTSVLSYRLRRAADLLRAGAVLAHPTEAVWGLACLPGDAAAVARICELKQRDPGKGLLLVADSVERLAPLLAALPPARRDALLASWPGPVSWVIPDTEFAPDWVRGRHPSVAVRVSDHPLTAQLCRAVGSCLVSTSANPAGREPARSQYQAQRYFGAAVNYYLPGRLGGRTQPSRICDALSGDILRPG